MMHSLKRHSIFLSLSFVQFRSFSFIFCHFLSFSFIFFHFLSCFFMFFFFLGFCIDCLTISYEGSLMKIFFLDRLGGVNLPLGLFFLLSIFSFFVSFSFSFSISFHAFPFFICFSFLHFLFLYFPVVFLPKIVSSFFILFLFFLFSGAQNLWLHFWGKVHILSRLYLLCIGSSSLYHVE